MTVIAGFGPRHSSITEVEETPMPRRNAFTLVELLVVLTVIGILLGLSMAGIMSVRNRNMQAGTKIEILDMIAGLEAFKTKYSVYPPSQVTVGPSAAALDNESKLILSRIWPNLNYAQAFGASGFQVSGPTTLKGDQCLVLFLGGLHTSTGCLGFSTSRSNPFAAGGDREQPYFKFQPTRLFQRDASVPFCSYGDGFYGTLAGGVPQKTAYAYFAPTRAGGYVDTHCGTLADFKGNIPRPMKDAAGQYIDRQSFQLLSAGKDTLWGKARVWTVGAGIGDLSADPSNPDSVDNIANFAGGLLSGG